LTDLSSIKPSISELSPSIALDLIVTISNLRRNRFTKSTKIPIKSTRIKAIKSNPQPQDIFQLVRTFKNGDREKLLQTLLNHPSTQKLDLNK
jgi:hypothetical protein